MDYIPSRRGDRINFVLAYAIKTDISSGMVSHLAQMQNLPTFYTLPSCFDFFTQSHPHYCDCHGLNDSCPVVIQYNIVHSS